MLHVGMEVINPLTVNVFILSIGGSVTAKELELKQLYSVTLFL